jgi:hypothetical protein
MTATHVAQARRLAGNQARWLAPLVVLALGLAAPTAALAQNNPSPAVEDDPDLDPNTSQPDFTIVNLPTTLRLPRFKSAFRVTHRFTRPLGQGDVGNLVEDLFGFDSSSLIGLEYRFGLMRGLQVGILRTSNRTIEFFGNYNVIDQRRGAPVGLSVIATVDGTNNFRDQYSPALGVVLSRELGSAGAIYVEPVWVHNSNLLDEPGTDNGTLVVGLGARLRILSSTYLVGEFIPRAGYEALASDHHATFGIEKRAGGHVFQVNFSNGFGNTMGQLARGGTSFDDWYIGFNISRKFF